jgi:act minimal PKS acyl carrier protein
MRTMTLDDLLKILTEAAGYGDSLDQATDVAAAEFEDLGYDSLALLETAARIEQDFGVTLPDDQITESRTPRELLDLVNSSLAEAA